MTRAASPMTAPKPIATPKPNSGSAVTCVSPDCSRLPREAAAPHKPWWGDIVQAAVRSPGLRPGLLRCPGWLWQGLAKQLLPFSRALRRWSDRTSTKCPGGATCPSGSREPCLCLGRSCGLRLALWQRGHACVQLATQAEQPPGHLPRHEVHAAARISATHARSSSSLGSSAPTTSG